MSTGTDKEIGSGKQGEVAICGIGCIFPQADNLEAYWDNIKQGVNSITDVPKETHWSPEDYLDVDPKAPDMTYAARGGFLSPIDFNPMDYGIAPKDIEATDTTQIFGMIAAREALKDAGYWEAKHFDRSRTSVILGVTSTLELAIPLGARLGHPIWRQALKDSGLDEEVTQEVVERISDGYVDWQENSFPGLLGNVAAGRIANRFDLGGTNCVVDAACASSLSALHLAAMELASGKADMVLTGGIDTFNDIFMYMCFSKTPALSPTGEAKPFSKNGDGTILGEGLGIVVLKRREDAERDGDKIYAVLKGIGTSSDGKGNAIYAPSAKGQMKALRRAYEIAGVQPSSIELVEGHGTGTKVGDATEVSALTEVYSDADRKGSWCALGSVKSQIGHTKAASGIAALIKAAMALHQRVLPPTIKVTEPLDVAAPGKSPFYVNTVKRPWVKNPDYPRRAAVSSFGFGGSNFHCVLEEAAAAKPAGRVEITNQIIAFSGSDPGALLKKLDGVPESAKWREVREFAARSRGAFDAKAPYRLFLVCANEPGSLSKALAAARRNLSSKPGSERWSTPEGAISGRAEATGKLGVLFPGQGSQYVGMMRDLACQFPEFLNVFDGANETFKADQTEDLTDRLSDYVYPHPGFDKETPQRQAETLKQTQIAQPAIGAACLGGFKVLQAFGLQAEVVGGHSYGELVALHAAGRIDAETFHTLSNFRGRLMAAASQAKQAGGMLVVKASLETVEELLAKENCELVIANHNAPDQIVLAGTLEAVQKTSALFSDRSIWNRTLPVSAAFHSPLVANAREPFLARLAKAEIGEGEIPVFANSTADVYPDAADEVRDILAGQLAKPVRFVEQVQAMYECGVRTFVEVGPGNVLAGLVKAILKDQEVTVVSLDASKGRVDGMRDLALALAELAAAGHAVNLSLWDEEFSRSPDRNRTQKSKLNFPICGANQRSPKPVRPPSPARAQMPEGSVSSVPASAPAPVKSALAESHLSVSMTPHTQTGAVPPADLDQALRASREGLIALQKLQEQTGELHRKFLEGQDTALKTFLALVEQQKGLVGGATSAHPGLVRSVAPAVAPSQPVAPVRPQEVVPTPVPAAKVPSAQPASEVANVLMAVVAEKTGYPVEMLNLEMGLDSDLGIDSIKRVEIMSALQARLPDAPEIKPDQLGSLQTLQQVVDFLDANPAPAAASAASAGPAADQAAAALLEVVAEKTGYPAEMLNLEMGLDSDLGIDSIKRVEIMSALQARLPEAPEIKPDQLGSLETLQQVVDYLGSGTGAPETGSGAAPAAGLGQDQVAPVLLEIVAEKTGYPAEMLNLEMGLDSDLGIDSIKRVEIMSALQARLPEAPEIKPDQLGSLETLQQVVSFLSAAPAAATIGSVASATAAVGLDEAAVSQSLLGIVSEKTGYPVEMLNLEMGLDSDLGIDSIKRVEIMSALQGELTGVPEIKPEDLGTFQTLQNVVQFLCANGSAAGSTASGASANAIAPKVEAVAEQTLERLVVRPVVGRTEVVPDKISLEQGALVWLADDGTKLARQVEKELGMLGCQVVRGGLTALRQQALPARLGAVVILAASGPHQHEQVRDSFALMQHVSPALRRTGKTASAVFVTVSRLDGRFGLQGLNGNSNPVSGGLAGMTKTAQHEWPEVHCKAIDLDAEAKDFTKIAQAIVREVFLAGPVEVGLSDSSRCTVELQSVPMPDSAVKPALAKGEVVVVSGGGRGVTAQTALALAQACQPTLVLLGRSPNPESEPAWLSSLTDTTAIKRAIHANLNGKSTLKDVEAQFRRWMGNREVTANMRAMEQGGAKVLYRSVDIRDAAAVGSLFTELRAEHGPIRGLIHGAGVLADRKIEDKTNEQFEQVYSTKVAGLQALLQGTQKDDLKIMALFSSFTGRYGRPGQVDYAAANEVLNKLAQFESQRRPNCRVVSVNWGPWNGGMVTSALKTIFEKEGVGLIEPEAGADYLVKELSLGADGPVEVVVVAPSPGLGDFGESSVRPAEVVPEREAASQVAPGEAAIEMTVSVDGLPCLRSHVINGKAVVPAALTVEWLAHGALHGHPGMVFNGLNDFAVLKGIILGEDESLALSVNVLPATTTAEGMTVPVQLVSQHAGGTRIHARAQAVLGHGVLKSGDPTILDTCKPDRRQRKELYQNELLFHGADLEGIERLTECDATGISGTVNPAPKPASWIADPLRQSWISEPLMLDSCFQLMILWSLQQQGAHSLPTGFSKFRQYVRRFPAQPMTVRLRVTAIEQQMVRARMECLDAKGKLLASLEGYECVLDASLKAAFAKNRLVGLQQA